ncbi:hypothetical protein Glove_553g11 [Diversispora epigaea]|uniref:Uncharacterized protein n=1 Tax=Diversispora epigaea TaxID=1348612 RepID=A0A397GH33_9GLOM|nr:hypothetical protein Glove_553g11 [Diversispora epigaea]
MVCHNPFYNTGIGPLRQNLAIASDCAVAKFWAQLNLTKFLVQFVLRLPSLGESIEFTSKQDASQSIAKRLRSAEKKKEVSEDPKQKKRKKNRFCMNLKKSKYLKNPKSILGTCILMTQNALPYSIVSDLLAIRANITLGQLMAMPHYRSEIRKALTPKRTRIVKMVNHTIIEGNTPITCKAQKTSGRKITDIHRERCPSLGIVTQVPIKLEEIVVAVDMEVIDAAGYALILGTDWLRKACAIIDYQEYKLILKDEKATVLNDDKEENDSEEEYEESSDDSDIDEEEVNFAGLTYELLTGQMEKNRTCLYQESYKKYKFTSEGMCKNSKLATWELYDQLFYCFDPIRRKKETSQDICKVCEEYQQDEKIISIISQKEIQNIRCNLVQGRVEKLEGNQYKSQVHEVIEKFLNLVVKDLSELGKTDLY